MEKSLLLFFTFLAITFIQSQTTINVFSNAVYYDGYAATVSQPVPTDAIRLNNARYTKKLTDVELNSFQNKVTLNLKIGALCDNYDRLGSVHLALVPKNQATYTIDDPLVKRIEIGRYITPFMNKNVAPTSVPYTFSVDNLYYIFSNTMLRNTYDIWVELDLFGVPYAANTQVSGCANRIDVFTGTLDFVTSNDPSISMNYNNILPLLDYSKLNNYNNTDVAGQTVRIVNFNLSENSTNAKFTIISTPHGSNSGGEEYVRRQNIVYLDNSVVLTYTPGGKSCEPYRMYNTQGNGIYGSSAQSTSWWTGWNNWCPGDAVPIRSFSIPSLAAGSHTLRQEIPTAVFNGQQGEVVLSMYMQSLNQNLAVSDVSTIDVSIFPNPTSDFVNVKSDKKVKSIAVYNMEGQKLMEVKNAKVNLTSYPSGTYILDIHLEDGNQLQHKVIRR